MEMYSLLRAFADSWALMALFAVFLGMVVWVFRPAARMIHNDAANSIFRDDTKPAGPASLEQEA